MRLGHVQRPAAALVALSAWGGLGLQFKLFVWDAVARGADWGPTLASHYSYFTILTNLLLALVATLYALTIEPRRWHARPALPSAVAAYIAIVCIIYEALLRKLWTPTGDAFIADLIVHDATPALYLLFWLLLIPKGALRWRDPFIWLIWPVAYLGYALARGQMIGSYAYPFIDLGALGPRGVAINAAGQLALFLFVGLVLVTIDRWAGGERNSVGQPKRPEGL